MPRTLLTRIERIEKAADAKSIVSSDCICFPKNEPPFFCFLIEEQIAEKVKCPLHGERFKPIKFRMYVSKWRREGELLRRLQLSAQYRKAWDASFPPELWPAQEVLVEDRIVLRLKDGTILPRG